MAQEKALACFDFDGTMIRGDSIVSYLRFARKCGWMTRREMAAALWHTGRYFLRLEDGDQVKTHALSFLQKLTEAQKKELDESFVRDHLLPRIYPSALRCWREHREAGRKMLLVSASTDNYMPLVARFLAADALLCTHLLPSGRVEGNCKGEEKVRRIRRWLREESIQADWPASYAYGDSLSDLPMLLLTGHPTQVNPKKKLKKKAPAMARVQWAEKK